MQMALGRSVTVAKGRVADAIRQLDSILNKNKVRQTLRLAQRHEKRGEKRRRLESERWRKQFANEVRFLMLYSSPQAEMTDSCSRSVRKYSSSGNPNSQ